MLLLHEGIWIYFACTFSIVDQQADFDWSVKSIPFCGYYYNDFHSRHKDLVIIYLTEDLSCAQK